MGEVNLDNIKNDEFFLFYEMMVQALKTDDVVDGINSSLDLLKLCLNSGDIILHHKDDLGVFIPYVSQTSMNHATAPITDIVNKASNIVESKGIFKFDLSLSEKLKNITLIYLKTHDNEYILSINNVDFNHLLNSDFFDKLQETMLIILKRAELYERNTRAITNDLLTGLDNRNSYESRIKEISQENTDLVFGIFDLFRLKHINDCYTHEVGDKYIKASANILKKYWPKEETVVMENGLRSKNRTGHCVYRVGGDEFILLTSAEDYQMTLIKSKLATEEVELLDLGLEDKPVIGLNSGITFHKPQDTIKDTYRNADMIMMEDKRKMYVKHNLERRKSN